MELGSEQKIELSSSTEAIEDSTAAAISAGIASAQKFEERYGVNILTQEARLLGLIKGTPGRPLKFYLSTSGLSQRWFSITVEKLLCAGLIEKCRCENDIRSKTLW